MGKRRKNLKNIKAKVENNLANTKDIPDVLIGQTHGFNFYSVYDWLNSTDEFISSDGFTNNLSSPEQFAKNIYLVIHEMIPKLYKDCDSIFNFGSHMYPHCHTVKGNSIELVKKIAEKVNGSELLDVIEDEDYSWWQVGFTGSIRMFGIYNKNENSFFPLFVDWHHLIYESIKYNGEDYSNYNYSPGGS